VQTPLTIVLLTFAPVLLREAALSKRDFVRLARSCFRAADSRFMAERLVDVPSAEARFALASAFASSFSAMRFATLTPCFDSVVVRAASWINCTARCFATFFCTKESAKSRTCTEDLRFVAELRLPRPAAARR
jgi:hypothetical protein